MTTRKNMSTLLCINNEDYEARRLDNDPLDFQEIRIRDLQSPSPEVGGNIIINDGTRGFEVPTINLQEQDSVSLRHEFVPSSPASPNMKNFHSNRVLSPNSLLLIPPSGPFVNLSPRPLRRALSARGLNELSYGSASPRIRKLTRPPSLIMGPADLYGDSISAINVPVGHTETKEETGTKRDLSMIMSGIYAVFLVTLGAIIYINDQHREHRTYSELFSSVIAIGGILWLLVFHIDLCRYKKEVLKQLKEKEDAIQEASDKLSCATEFIINTGFDFITPSEIGGKHKEPPPYRFLLGRHSGSFYLKIGSAGFCFGFLIYQGLELGQHILNFADDERLNCSAESSVILHIVIPLYAFYQLFFTFKYSNIVINRWISLARFGLMHLIATCLCNWFSTILEEAVQDYTHKSNVTDNISSEFQIANFHVLVRRRENWSNPYLCNADSVLSTRSLSAVPYLYPFAIEYNLLLAGVWFIVWQNIGQQHSNSNPHHLRHTISHDEMGSEAIAYQSNLVINADCHAANKGLFAGLFLLLTIICTVIVFFVAMTTKGYQERAVHIHTAQEGLLTFIGLIAVFLSFYQIRKLDISEHPITFLDDVLLFIPLPFYFVHGIMSMMAEYDTENYTRLALHILVTIQVVVQTPFIIDGLRRCSNSQSLRYKKPGREIITFLIILNLTLWIVNTFELKSVEHFHGQEEYFGDLVWMFIGHTTVPLMLFYRFHSSVCLADMWKSAYEKEAHQ